MNLRHLFLDFLLRFQSFITLPLSPIKIKSAPSAEGYIYGQGSLSGKRLYLAKAENTACEAVAVYNAAVSFGAAVSFHDVCRAFLTRGALTLIFLGFFGGNPYSIKRVLRLIGLKGGAVGADETLKDGRYIISFWNGEKKLSLHTVFVRVINGSAAVYNFYPGDVAPRSFDIKKLGGLIIRCWRVEKAEQQGIEDS